jgi:hypothetical protein
MALEDSNLLPQTIAILLSLEEKKPLLCGLPEKLEVVTWYYLLPRNVEGASCINVGEAA